MQMRKTIILLFLAALLLPSCSFNIKARTFETYQRDADYIRLEDAVYMVKLIEEYP